MNRITQAISEMRRRLEQRPQSEGLDSSRLDITFDEYVVFQDTKSLAQANGTITFDESQTIYAILGSGPTDFNARDLARKLVVTQVMAELLKAKPVVAV